MMSRPAVIALVLLHLALFFTPLTFAQQNAIPVVQFKQYAQLEKLYLNKEWLTLGHYRPNTVLSGYVSQADDADFFISPEGKNNPEAELIASIDALLGKQQNPEHLCQFPARRHWLLSQMKQQGLIKQLPPAPSCKQYDEWLNTLNTKTVTLVFASSYLNSPSSMFGHTFLRLDQPDQSSDNLLLANTISYAADGGENENELMFAYRGIFGGYPGVTTIEPYYDKIKLYSHLENRDLWEYQLNLTQAETAQLLRATWEIKEQRFDYYFFDENCSYRILALIDIARPGTRLLDEISYRAIPSDTVRLILKKDLVDNIHYRASASTSLKNRLVQLSQNQQMLLLQIIDQGLNDKQQQALSGYSPVAQADILDTAFDYLRFQAIDKKQSHNQTAELSHQLLLTRSKLNVHSNIQPAKTPQTRDDEGHETLRFGFTSGQLEAENYLGLSIRPAYHDLGDPIDGYQKGAQLQFLRGDFRYYPKQHQFQVEEIVGIEIMSLSPRDQFFKPISWQVGFGGRRVLSAQGRILTPYLEGGAGLSYPFFNGMGYSLLTADLEISSKVSQGYNLGPGAVLAWVYQGSTGQTQLGAKTIQFIEHHHHQRNTLFIDQSITLSKAWSLNLNLKREKDNEIYNTEWGISARYYY